MKLNIMKLNIIEWMIMACIVGIIAAIVISIHARHGSRCIERQIDSTHLICDGEGQNCKPDPFYSHCTRWEKP